MTHSQHRTKVAITWYVSLPKSYRTSIGYKNFNSKIKNYICFYCSFWHVAQEVTDHYGWSHKKLKEKQACKSSECNLEAYKSSKKRNPCNRKLNQSQRKQKSHSQADCFHGQMYPPCEERVISTDPWDQFQDVMICSDFLGGEC